MRHHTRSTMVRSRRGVAGLALMLSLLGACSGSADPQGSPDSISGSRAPVAEPTGGGPTAKTPETPETPETLGDERGVYLMDPATGAVEQISSAVGEVIGPEMSPDGSLLVYQSRAPDGTPQIFVQEAGGTEQQLTDFPAGARDPTWSPNGKRIAFAARSGDDNTDIFVMDADGGRI